MQVVILILHFIITECQLSQDTKSKDDLEFWKPDIDLRNILKKSTKIQRKITKNDKPIFRQDMLRNETSSKWPKIMRKFTSKSAARITQMYHMHEAEQTTVIDLNDTNETDVYNSFSSYAIKHQLELISYMIPNANVTLEVIGRTVEYQDIVLLKIAKDNREDRYFRANDNKYDDDKPEKKIIFIVHGLSVMGMDNLSCLSYLASFLDLVSFYVKYLDQFDIFLIPMANPDGYAFSQVMQAQRRMSMWNKNVAPQTECAGVALDRNFDVAWSNKHSISSCSQDYPGTMPFSEVESRSVRDIFHKYSHKIVAYLNVHAGTYSSSIFKGDAVLYPKGYTDSIADEDKFIDLKGEIDEAMRNASFQVYSVAVETLYNWYGKVTGSSVDYAATVYGIPFSLELVMQLYSDKDAQSDEYFSDSALFEVWSRVIDVLFNYIWKSFNKDNEVR